MALILPIEEFLGAGGSPVLDVRSPAEYEQGHIPGAISFPLFSNEERAEIGTLYKKEGREMVVFRGLEIVAPRLKEMTEKGIGIAGKEKELRIHCWRGGMRSAAVALLMEAAGIKVILLKKGYKAYRNFVLAEFEKPLPLIILGGKTGSGKTAILKKLEEKGEQTADLEALASHKGSAFGWLNENPQPTSEQFENDLCGKLLRLDKSKPVWMEDESAKIGTVNIPHSLFLQIRNAPVIRLEVPVEKRIQNLVSDYAGADKSGLSASFRKIEKRLGAENLNEALEAIEAGTFSKAAAIALKYYDKTYETGLSMREPEKITLLDISFYNSEEVIEKILRLKMQTAFPDGKAV